MPVRAPRRSLQSRRWFPTCGTSRGCTMGSAGMGDALDENPYQSPTSPPEIRPAKLRKIASVAIRIAAITISLGVFAIATEGWANIIAEASYPYRGRLL